MKKKFVFFMCVVLINTLPAQETTATPGERLRISPDEAVQMAVRNNLSLESSRMTTATRRRASDLSWNQFLPNVTIGGSLMMDNEKSNVSGMAPMPIPLNPLFQGMLPPETPDFYGVIPFSQTPPGGV